MLFSCVAVGGWIEVGVQYIGIIPKRNNYIEQLHEIMIYETNENLEVCSPGIDMGFIMDICCGIPRPSMTVFILLAELESQGDVTGI